MVIKKAKIINHRYMEDPLIRSLRVQAWFRAVTLASGKTPAQLEREFSEKRSPPRMLPRSCIWEKYRRGEIVPRGGRRADGSPNLVERVEARYPGTKAWLFSPLWRLADKAPMEMSEIRQVYEAMPPQIRSIFVAPSDKIKGCFWRRPVDPQEACDALSALGGIDALVASLNLIKEGEASQDQFLHYTALVATSDLIYHLRDHQIIGGSCVERLIRYLRSRFRFPGYLDMDAT